MDAGKNLKKAKIELAPQNDLTILLKRFPQKHDYSLNLAKQLPELQLNPPLNLLAANLQSEGLVKVELRAGKLNGYGAQSWVFLIGGAGIGSEESDDCGSPVGVRVTTPISHSLVNDIGFANDTFWASLNENPSLREIVTHCSTILEGPLENGLKIASQRWFSAESYTFNKLEAIRSYKSISKSPQLIHSNQMPIKWDKSWLHARFLEAVEKDDSSALRDYATEESPGIFSFDFLSHKFCDMLIDEIDIFESSTLPKRRPNTMNNYGIILADMGMYGLVTSLLEDWLAPIAVALYPQEPVAYGLDHHHSFFVQYNPHGGDLGLDMHHDRHAGASNHRRLQHVCEHVKGRAVVHLGRHRHGADPVEKMASDVPATVASVYPVELGLSSTPPASSSSSPPLPSALAAAAMDASVGGNGSGSSSDAESARALKGTASIFKIEDCSRCSSKTGAQGSASTSDSVASSNSGGVAAAVVEGVDRSSSSSSGSSDNSKSSESSNKLSVTADERINLIVWARSSAFRAAAAFGHIMPDGFPRHPEDGLPDLCCLSKFNDDDYVSQKAKIEAEL